MSKGIIYFLLIWLACKYINCESTCPDGEVLVNGKCEKCLPPNVISKDKVICFKNCNENEFIESKGNYYLCVEKCSKHLGSDLIHCQDNCPIKDKTKTHISCLNKFSECTTGVISRYGSECRESCNRYQMIIEHKDYRQCADCNKITHQHLVKDYYITCIKRCNETEIYDLNYSCILRSSCTGFIDLDSQMCQEKCKGYIMGNSDNPQYQLCSDSCSQFKYQINDNQKYCYDKCPEKTIIDETLKQCHSKKEDCLKKISMDEQFCVSSCGDNEFIKPGKYEQCQSGCSEFEYEQFGMKYCSEQCPPFYVKDKQKQRCYENKEECEDVISSDEYNCVKSCQENEYLQKSSVGNFMLCKTKCYNFEYQYEIDGKQYCMRECPENMVTDKLDWQNKCHADINGCAIAGSADEKNCIRSCNLYNREVIVFKKCTACTDYYSKEKNTCQKSCSENQITDTEKKLCYKSAKDCLGFLSSDSTQCIRKCDSQKKEFPIYQFISSISQEIRQCKVCQDYFTEGKDGAYNSCKYQCDDNYFAIIPLKTCTMNLDDCKNYIMSADGRSCDANCKYPKILKEGKCIMMNECSGDNEIIDETADPIECKNKADHGHSCQLESSDGRRCVHSCLPKQIKRQLSLSSLSYQCEDCKPSEKYFITFKENKQIEGCKESISFGETIETFVLYLDSGKTVEDFEQAKVGMTDFMSTQYISQPPEPSELLQTFKELAKQFFSALLNDNLSSVKYNVHCVGSSSNALVCLQLIDKGRSIQKSFIIESILKNLPLDLTETSNSNTDSDSSGILLFIFKNNPHCKKASCKKFPVVVVENIDLRGEGNLSVKGLGLRAIFTKNQLFGLYLCYHYDNDLTQVVDNSFPETDKITFSCPLDEPASVEIDETCQFSLDSSTCGFTAISWSIRASGKMSALICVVISVFIA